MAAFGEASLELPRVAERLVLTGDLDLVTEQQLRNVLARVISRAPSGFLVLDLAQVKFMDCRGLAVLVWAKHMIRDELILASPSSAVTRLLDLADLRESFMIVDERR